MFNPFDPRNARPSLRAYLHNKISGYLPGRPLTKIHASDVTKPGWCARRRALQWIHHDKPADEYVTTCQRKVFDEGKAYEKMLREEWAGDIAVGDWQCGWCGGVHQIMRKPEVCHHCHRPAPMIYNELRFQSKVSMVSCGLDVLMLLPGRQKATLVEVKTIAAQSTQKSTPVFGTLTGALAEHMARTSWYLRLIEESGNPLAQYVDLREFLVLYISKGYGETDASIALNGISEKQTPFKEYWCTRDDDLSQEYDNKARPLAEFMHTGKLPDRRCASPDDQLAQKCPKRDACFSSAYPPGQILYRGAP